MFSSIYKIIIENESDYNHKRVIYRITSFRTRSFFKRKLYTTNVIFLYRFLRKLSLPWLNFTQNLYFLSNLSTNNHFFWKKGKRVAIKEHVHALHSRFPRRWPFSQWRKRWIFDMDNFFKQSFLFVR